MAAKEMGKGRSVTAKVLSIFEAFEDEPRALSMSQIAVLAGLPTSTAHRLITELADWGALKRDENGRYQIGLRMWELSQNAGRMVRETARPNLQDLHRLTQETSLISMREGYAALTLERVYGSDRLPKSAPVGSRLPLHTTAVGLVLLAHEEQWFQEAYLRRDLETFTPKTIGTRQCLRGELEQIREQAFAHTVESVRLGSASIAVPVFGDKGEISVALGLVLRSGSTELLDRYLPILKGIARKIEKDVLFRRTPYKPLWPSFPTPKSVRPGSS